MKYEATIRVFGNPHIAYAVITGAIKHFGKDVNVRGKVGWAHSTHTAELNDFTAFHNDFSASSSEFIRIIKEDNYLEVIGASLDYGRKSLPLEDFFELIKTKEVVVAGTVFVVKKKRILFGQVNTIDVTEDLKKLVALVS